MHALVILIRQGLISHRHIKNDFKEADKLSSVSKEVARISRLRDVLKAGYLEEYYDKVGGYIKRWKDEYREEISV